LPLGSPYGDLLKERKITEEQMKLKNLTKIANPQAFTAEYFVFLFFSWKFSHYIVLEAKCVGNWKSKTN
jgi:hypothetical protein